MNNDVYIYREKKSGLLYFLIKYMILNILLDFTCRDDPYALKQRFFLTI